MEEPLKLIWVFVALMITASVLSFALALGGLVSEVSRNEQREVTARDLMREYREFNIYNNLGLNSDNVIFHTADVMTAIMAFRGEVEVALYSGPENAWTPLLYAVTVDAPPSELLPIIWASRQRVWDNVLMQNFSQPAPYGLEPLAEFFENPTRRSEGGAASRLAARRWVSRLHVDDGGNVYRISFRVLPL
jgi:hypothetical protein